MAKVRLVLLPTVTNGWEVMKFHVTGAASTVDTLNPNYNLLKLPWVGFGGSCSASGLEVLFCEAFC